MDRTGPLGRVYSVFKLNIGPVRPHSQAGYTANLASVLPLAPATLSRQATLQDASHPLDNLHDHPVDKDERHGGQVADRQDRRRNRPHQQFSDVPQATYLQVMKTLFSIADNRMKRLRLQSLLENNQASDRRDHQKILYSFDVGHEFYKRVHTLTLFRAGSNLLARQNISIRPCRETTQCH